MISNRLKPGKANLEVFAETLTGLAEKSTSIFAVTSDSRGSGKLTGFGERFPGGRGCRSGINRKKGLCGLPFLLPDHALAGTNQKRRGLFRPTGCVGRYQCRGQLRCAGINASFAS